MSEPIGVGDTVARRQYPDFPGVVVGMTGERRDRLTGQRFPPCLRVKWVDGRERPAAVGALVKVNGRRMA